MVDKAIPTDALEVITAAEGEDAEAAFLRAYAPDADKPSGDADEEKKKAKPAADAEAETSEETPEEDADTEGDETEQEAETEGEDDSASRKRVVLDQDAEAFVKHKVDGKEVEIPVKELTRLYGQEAALTRKSQETAAAQKAVEENGARYTAGLETLLQRALDDFKPYADINFLALAKDPTISAEDLAALQTQATAAYNNVNFLNTQLDETVKSAEAARVTNLRTAAVASWKVLADPATGITGWDEPLYNEIRTYAKATGLPARSVDELVDPAAIKILHKAMLYDKGQQAAAKSAVKVVKVDKEPKRIIKATPAPVIAKSKANGVDGSMAKLASTGDVDDAAAVFLARMNAPQ